MFQRSYDELDAAQKIELPYVAHTDILYILIDSEIVHVKEELCNLTVGAGMELSYAIIQQRLLSLQDLRDFFNRIKEETTPHPDTE